MGKSPARWIKGFLLGKKSSKSSASKGRERALNQKEVLITTKIEEPPAVLNPSVVSDVSDPVSNLADRSNNVQGIQNTEASKASDGEIQVAGGRPSDLQRATSTEELSDAEKIQQQKAAIALQAAFRGYLARRAFWALKGIIRLQALIRGHLVRRQAVATLYCVMGIVKLQAFARGIRVRYSEIGVEVRRKSRLQLPLDGTLADSVSMDSYLGIKKLTANAFVLKLLAPSPKVMPLRLQYDSSDPNSYSSWLENWSTSRFWKPIPQPKKPTGRKPHKKLGNGHMADAEATRPKKSVRKVPAANLDNPSVQTQFEFEKPKRNFRKVPSQMVEPPVQENPQVELEKIKRNLRKVHNPVVENSIQQIQPQPEVEVERPKLILEKTSQSQPSLSVHDVVEQPPMNISDENVKKEPQTPERETKQPVVETPEPLEVTETLDPSPVDQTDQADKVDLATVEQRPLMENETKEEKTPKTNTRENSTGKENQKSGKNASVAAKNERAENNGHQTSPSLPSYMQATQSAKAKLRLQGSPRSAGQDTAEKSNVSRRHSLPSSGNGRIASHSPRTQRAANLGGKVGGKSEKPLPSSREGNAKPAQAEWRR